MDYCRQLNPATGDVVFDDSRASWAEGHPALEIALRTLRTKKGTAGRDRNEGIMLDDIDPALPSAKTLIASRVRLCLDPYVRLGIFTIDSIEVDIVGDAFFADIEITDPRDPTGVPIPSGRVALPH